MQLTGWTHYENKNFVGPLEERWNKYRNKNKIFPKQIDVQKYAEDNNISLEESSKILLDKYNKIPDWIDEEKVKEYEKINEECTNVLVDYCVKNHIFISDDEHQNEDWGCPVFDNKWKLTFTLRAWSGIMAEVWNRILGIDTLNYLDFYCMGNSNTIIKDYKKPLDIV